ncbi:ABC transporter ATP-binding protein [Hoeflea sp.]|uniref:ABC transporter ATP-binding protein n=1 Tax=Hoeflea sp. TaxID=1940281 RepID=UPI003B028203
MNEKVNLPSDAISGPRIEIKAVTHAYKTDSGPLPVLDDLNFSCADQSFTAVVGPSGCGKSTLTRLVAGLLKPDHGDVYLHGEKVTGPRATVGMAFQNPVLLEWRTITENVVLPLEIVPNRLSNAERTARAHELLSLVGLAGFENKRPSELSGGMRQRASLCRAIVHRPEVLILDEPFGALDAFTREDLWQTMHALRKEENVTSILITHDLRESVFLADRVIVLSGRPAHVQFTLDVNLPQDRTIEDLYSPEATDMLHELRHQIEIAQGRVAADALMSAVKVWHVEYPADPERGGDRLFMILIAHGWRRN